MAASSTACLIYYWLTWVCPGKRPLNELVVVVAAVAVVAC